MRALALDAQRRVARSQVEFGAAQTAIGPPGGRPEGVAWRRCLFC